MADEINKAKESIKELEQVAKSSAEAMEQAALNAADSFSKLAPALKKQSEDLYKGMLESERLYLSEAARLEEENERIAEVNRQREYQKRLAAAKNATNLEIVKQNEILRRKKLADEEYLAQLKETAEREKELLEKLKGEISDIYKDIADFASDSLGETLKAQESMEEKLSDVGNLTRKQIFHGLGKDGEDLTYTVLSDIDPQIDALMRYSEALNTVKDRISAGGFSAETAKNFFNTAAELSFEEGLAFAELLSDADDNEFSEYLSKWTKKQELSELISKQLYSDEFKKAVDDTKAYMVERLSEAGLEIPDGFTLSGSLSAENFGTAFIEEMQVQMDKVRKLINSFSLSSVPASAQSGAAALSAGGGTGSSTTYILNSSGETVAEQLRSARIHSEMERMRNG